MPIATGTHKLGPDNASLHVKTGRSGAAAAAGHDLVLNVTSWEATLEVGDRTSLELTADATSLSVLEGKGGMKALTEDDKADIKKSIDKDVLKKKAIHFKSSDVEGDGPLTVKGDLEIAGRTSPVQFTLDVAEDGALQGSAPLKQSDFAIKPYSALFGALKVNDELEVVVEATVPTA